MKSSEVYSEGSPYTRRRFMAGLLGSASVLVLYGLTKDEQPEADRATLDANQKSLEELRKIKQQIKGKVYRFGDTIPGPIPIEVENAWQLSVHGGEGYRFIDGTSLLLSANTHNTLVPAENSVFPVSNVIDLSPNDDLKKREYFKEEVKWKVRPATIKELKGRHGPNVNQEVTYSASDYLTDADSQVSTVQFSVPLELPWYAGDRRRGGLVDPSEDLVVSAWPIDPEVYSSLRQTIQHYQKYMVKRSTFAVLPIGSASDVFSKFDTDVASYSPDEDIVSVSDNFLEKPSLDFVFSHELNHALFFEFKDHEENQGAINEFDNIYKNFVFLRESEEENNFFSYTCSPSYIEVVKIFDESSYTGVSCVFGHPGDNPDELFASGLNCITLFEPQMVERLNGLTESEREAALIVIAKIIAITDKLGQSAGANLPFVDLASNLRKF